MYCSARASLAKTQDLYDLIELHVKWIATRMNRCQDRRHSKATLNNELYEGCHLDQGDSPGRRWFTYGFLWENYGKSSLTVPRWPLLWGDDLP